MKPDRTTQDNPPSYDDSVNENTKKKAPAPKKRAAPPKGKNTISIAPDKNSSQYKVSLYIDY